MLMFIITGYKNDDDTFCCVPVNPPLLFSFAETKLEIINNFMEKFDDVGLKLAVNDGRVMISSVPLCLKNRAEKEVIVLCDMSFKI